MARTPVKHPDPDTPTKDQDPNATAADAAPGSAPRATPANAPRDLNPAPPRSSKPVKGDDRPLWRVNEKSFVGHAQVEMGETIIYELEREDSEIGDNLSPLNAAAQAIVDGQLGPHPDKKGSKKSRAPRAAADAASADLSTADAPVEDDFA